MKKKKATTKKGLPKYVGPIVIMVVVACAEPMIKPKKKKEEDSQLGALNNFFSFGSRVLDLWDLLQGAGPAQATQTKPLSKVSLVFNEVPEGTHGIMARRNPDQVIPIQEANEEGYRFEVVVPTGVLLELELVFVDEDENELGVFEAPIRTETFIATYPDLVPGPGQFVYDHGTIVELTPKDFAAQKSVSFPLGEEHYFFDEKVRTARVHFVNPGPAAEFQLEVTMPVIVYQKNRLFPVAGTETLSLDSGEEIGLYPYPGTDSTASILFRVAAQ